MKKKLVVLAVTVLSLMLCACGSNSSDYAPGYDSYYDYFEDAGIPDPFIFIDELISQGYSNDVDELRRMVDEIGYYPSVLFGDYIADTDRVIHMTDGPCFEDIPSEKLIPIGPFASLKAVEREIADRDKYLDGYRICEKCCK